MPPRWMEGSLWSLAAASARVGSDLDALVAECRRRGRLVGAEEAVRGDEGEEDEAEHGAEGDGHRGPSLAAEDAKHAARLAPRHLLVAVVGQVQELRCRRAGGQDQVREHLQYTACQGSVSFSPQI